MNYLLDGKEMLSWKAGKFQGRKGEWKGWGAVLQWQMGFSLADLQTNIFAKASPVYLHLY